MSRAGALVAWMALLVVVMAAPVGADETSSPEDALLEALLLIDEKYVTIPTVPQYRGMAGQGLLRIVNAIGRSRVDLEDTAEEWTVRCAKRPLKQVFSKQAITSVETLYAALQKTMVFGTMCAEGVPVPPDLVYAAIKGVASALDSQSYLIEPSRYEDIKSESQEAVTGEVGLALEIEREHEMEREREGHRGRLVVSDVKLGMPADGAGIRLGDRLVRVDDVPVVGWSVTRAEALLRGSIGSSVVLSVERDGSGVPVTVTMTRQAHRFQSVKFQLLNGVVGYVRVILFHAQTAQDLTTAVERLQALNMKAMIVDLRDNAGGLLQSAIGAAEHFIERGGLIVALNGRSGQRDEYRSQASASPLTHPLIVLINQRTASSAEIVAAALRDWERAILVGTTSHGKGSVQSIYPLPGHYALRLTTAYYVTPLGQTIHHEGIAPDMVVESDDQQLAVALELLFTHAPSRSH